MITKREKERMYIIAALCSLICAIPFGIALFYSNSYSTYQLIAYWMLCMFTLMLYAAIYYGHKSDLLQDRLKELQNEHARTLVALNTLDKMREKEGE